MQLTIERSHAYVFLCGLYIGNLTNIFSNIVITGLLIYITNPEIFTFDRLEGVKSYVWNFVKPELEKEGVKSYVWNFVKPEPEKDESSFLNFPSLPKLELLSPLNK